MSGSIPPILSQLEPVSHTPALREAVSFFETGAASFRIHLDDACGMPSDWRSTWDRSSQWGLYGNKHWPTKYGAQGWIPHMIERSPFHVGADWQRASASVVVLFARHQAAGISIGQEQCLQRLEATSEAWRATNGSRHFFVFTDSRGPCCLDGKFKDTRFLRHHIIGPHAEPASGKSFTRRGLAPPLPCWDARKDVSIPTPNIHFPRTPFASPLLANSSAAAAELVRRSATRPGSRPLLMFYAGWNYGERMALVKAYQDDPDPAVLVRRAVAPDVYRAKMLQARFCPVCGGFSQWTPRLAETLHFGCVPVILSPHMEPPFSSLLDWSTFSVRHDPKQMRSLKKTLLALDHAALQRGVLRARSALEYHLDGYTGADMLPLLLFGMHQRLAAGPIALPRGVRAVDELYNDVSTWRNYDQGLDGRRSHISAHRVESHAGLVVHAVRSAAEGGNGSASAAHGAEGTAAATTTEERWQCSTFDGSNCPCLRWTDALDGALLRALDPGAATGAAASSARAVWGAPRDSGDEAVAWRAVVGRVRSLAGKARHHLTPGADYRSVRRHAQHLLSPPGQRALSSPELRALAARIAASRGRQLDVPPKRRSLGQRSSSKRVDALGSSLPATDMW